MRRDGDHNYTIRRKTGGEKLKISKFCPPRSQAHGSRREEEVVELAHQKRRGISLCVFHYGRASVYAFKPAADGCSLLSRPYSSKLQSRDAQRRYRATPAGHRSTIERSNLVQQMLLDFLAVDSCIPNLPTDQGVEPAPKSALSEVLIFISPRHSGVEVVIHSTSYLLHE